MEFSITNILIILSVFFNTVCFYPYIKDIFKGKTRPHLYTWVIWFVSQLVALLVMWQAGGGFASIVVLVNVALIFVICVLALSYGTKKVTSFDKKCLGLAAVTLVCYLYFANPLISLVFAIVTDVIGYFPTIRKIYSEPGSETAAFYAISVFSNICLLLSLSTYNINTYLYPICMALINFTTCLLIYSVNRNHS